MTSVAAKENTMSNAETVRAWKDPEYRSTLSSMPTHPAGLIELADPDLDGSAAKDGGFRAEVLRGRKTFGCHSILCPTKKLNTHGICCDPK